MVKGDEEIWSQMYKGCYVDGSYKGVGLVCLVDKIFDLEYLGTYCETNVTRYLRELACGDMLMRLRSTIVRREV